MSHIDDGALHAYLDGALDSYAAEEAARVRAHLDACPECAERLAEERGIREEADAILAASAPVVQMPPLEDLRALAQGRAQATHARGLSRLNRWSWAASVVLALGSGWMLRGAIPGMISPAAVEEMVARPGPAAPSADASPESLVGNTADESEALGFAEEDPLAEEGGNLSPADVVEAPSLQQRDRDVLEDAAPPELEAVGGGRGTPQPTESAPVEQMAPAAPPAAQVLATRPDSLGRAGEAQAGVSPPRAEQAVVGRERGAAVRPMLFESRARQDSPGAPVADEEADAAKAVEEGESGGSLAIRDLPVVDIVFVKDARAQADAFAAAAGTGAVRVRQILEGGDTLEIVHLPAGPDPAESIQSPADGRTQLVARNGEGWIILRAPVPRDTLEAYLRRLRGG